MPKAGGKEFPYTAAGRAAAKRQSAKTGKKVMDKKRKKKGGY